LSTSAPPRILVLDRTNELAVRLRHHVVVSGAVVKACPDLARAEAHLAGGHWDVLVVGPSLMHRAGLRRLAALHQRYPWVASVLALHERPRADLAEILRIGASDLLPLHAPDDELCAALLRAAGLTRARLGMMAGGPTRRSQGRVVMVASASGGCGKTFLATNAAEYLARNTNQPVVLFDLDLQFGEASIALRLRPETTIIDALAAEAEGYNLEEVLDDFLLRHPDGFKILAAPRQPAEADSVTPGDVARILDVLKARGAWVVIDTHEGLSDLFRAALEATDHVVAVATNDRPSLVNLGRYLGILEQLGMGPGNVSVVLNKTESGTDLSAEHVAIPYSRDVSRSINVGVPLLVGQPKSKISALLTTALSAVLSQSRTPQPQPVSSAAATVTVTVTGTVTDPPEPVAVIGAELVALTAVEPAVEAVEIDLTDDLPAHFHLAEFPPCRGRGPPCRISPRSYPSLVPALIIK
jgi:pilus assembly protein CpaE